MANKSQKPPLPLDTDYWLNYPAIRQMLPELRSVWVDVLCYLWQSMERGVLLKPTGVPYTIPEISRLIGCSLSDIQALIDNTLLQVRCDGAYYNERMVRADAISQARRKAGKRGGEKAIANRQTATVQQAPPTKPVPNQVKTDEPIIPALIDDNPPELTPEERKKADKATKYKYAEFVTLTRDEYAKLCKQLTEQGAKRCIEILDNYKGQNGKRYKSDYRAILNWVVNRYNEESNGNYRHRNRPGFAYYQPTTPSQLSANPGTSPDSQKETPKGYGERF